MRTSARSPVLISMWCVCIPDPRSSMLAFTVVGRTCSSLKSCGIFLRTRPFRKYGAHTRYTLSFEGVLAQWEAGNFDQIRPAEVQPFGGLLAAIKWSRTRGEAKQRELVDMTAYAEAGAINISSYLGMTEAASFETEEK